MSNEPPPPGSGPPPDDDPFRKPPPQDSPGGGPQQGGTGPSGGGGPSWGGGAPSGEGPPGEGPPGAGPYGGGPYGGPFGGTPEGGGPPPPGGPFGGGSFGGSPYGGGGPYGSPDPLAGMAPLAPSGKRVLARIIDMILVGIVVWLLSWAFGLTAVHIDRDRMQFGREVGQSLLAAVLYTGYDTFLIARTGQTLGKRLFHLRVANLNDGATPTPQVCLARAAVLWLPFAFCCACIWTAIAGGWSFFDKPYKQGLHDKAAKTVVVSTE